jgi:hypothetical protein
LKKKGEIKDRKKEQ